MPVWWQVLELEEPLSRLSVIHVAGTKGKVMQLGLLAVVFHVLLH
jgi:folylpolyglutamate synthase/dihydropteroate synthase